MEDKSYITKVSIPTENGGSIQKYLKDLEALHSDLFTGIGQILYRGAQEGEIIALQPVEGKILVIKNNIPMWGDTPPLTHSLTIGPYTYNGSQDITISSYKGDYTLS